MSSPIATSGVTMSEKRIAASTPWRRTGWSVISVISSGVLQAWSMVVPARSARYSGSDRPAWRMNHTGGRGPGRPVAARTSRESAPGRGTGTDGDGDGDVDGIAVHRASPPGDVRRACGNLSYVCANLRLFPRSDPSEARDGPAVRLLPDL